MDEGYVAKFKALGDSVRLEIIRMLSGKELCVCDILANLNKSQPVVSHHLKILKSAGLVSDQRRGKWIYYRLNPQVIIHLGDFLLTAAEEPVTFRERDCD